MLLSKVGYFSLIFGLLAFIVHALIAIHVALPGVHVTTLGTYQYTEYSDVAISFSASASSSFLHVEISLFHISHFLIFHSSFYTNPAVWQALHMRDLERSASHICTKYQ